VLAFIQSDGDKQLPMAVKVKICGLTRPEDVAAVVRAGADFAGLVFHPVSPRHLRPDQARVIAEQLRGRVRVVALLLNPTDDALAEATAAAKPDFIQLHGSETPKRVAEIRARFGLPIIKGMGIADDDDFHALQGYDAVADMLLFDSKPPTGGPAGGRGHAFDWQLLRKRTITTPWMLAGGLDADNVARAICASGAPGVDVSSGVESAPGIKDAGAIRAFIEAARRTPAVAEQPA
jgi:phosphoribosylanthranilate isomerase